MCRSKTGAERNETDSTAMRAKGRMARMGKSKKTEGRIGVWLGLVVLNIPTAAKFGATVLTIHTAPADAKSFGAAMLAAFQAIAGWPWWLSLTFSVGSLSLFAVYLFGTDGLLRLARFVFRRSYRVAEFRSVVDDKYVNAALVAIQASRLRANFNLSPVDVPPLPDATTPEDYTRVQDRFSFQVSRDPFGDRLMNLFMEIRGGLGRDPEMMRIWGDWRSYTHSHAEASADANQSNWHHFERGKVFPNPQIRREWHVKREEAAVANTFLSRVAARLDELKGALARVSPEEARWRRLLRELELEKLP
jgi:hypothetical protein